MRFLVLILVSLALAACSNVPRPHPFVVPDPFQTPLPFVQADQNTPLLASITEASSIIIEPVAAEGVLPPEFAGAVALEAQELDVPASTVAGVSNASRLLAEVSMDVVDEDARSVNVRIDWQLVSEDGVPLEAFSVTNAASFSPAPLENGLFVPDVWWQAVAAQSADELRLAIDRLPQMAVRAGISDAAMGPPLIVPTVTGAPGDGNQSLTRAVRTLLADADVNVIDPDRPPEQFDETEAYTLQGQVALGDVLDNGGQVISIGWDLYTANGRHLGNVAQQNLIEPGSLDGAWGETAIYAGLAAADGIIELLGAALPQAEQIQ